MKKFKLPPLRSIISIFLFPLFAFAQDVEDLGTIVVTASWAPGLRLRMNSAGMEANNRAF